MKKVFINNLLITLIFFFIFEIFLKSFGLSDLRGHGKEFTEKQKNVETTVFGKKVFLDKYGYRVPNKKFVYKNKPRKIIFIGDSVLFGPGVNEEETFVGKLRYANNDTLFVNAGIIGDDISEILTNVKNNYKLFTGADFFVFLSLDDIIDNAENNNSNEEEDINFVQKLKKNYFINKINALLRTKSYTYLWIKGMATKPSERYFFESFNYYNKEKKMNFFINKINEINNIKNLKKIEMTFIILPYEYQTRNQCEEKFLLPQKKIIKILKEKKITFIDLTKKFCGYLNPKKLYLNFDPAHLSIKGHNLVFESINKEIN